MDKEQWKMVPTVATPEMIDAFFSQDFTQNGYEEMLAAAPQPPSASGEREAAEAFAFASTNEPSGLLRHWWRKGYDTGSAASLTPLPGIDAAEQKPVYTIQVKGALHTWEPTAQAFTLTNGTYNLYTAPPAAQPSADAHPPSRACMCDACKPSFDNGADDPAQRYDIARQVPGPSSEWVAEAERLADKYASANAYAEVEGATNFRLPIKNARAALLAHLKARP